MYKEWFSAGRKRNPDINPVKFAKELTKWWDDLQPVTRKNHSKEDMVDIPPEQWCNVKIAGKNGIYLILIGLVWWGLELVGTGSSPETVPEWSGLVVDIQRVLECWTSAPNKEGPNGKRKQVDDTRAASKRRRK